MRFAYLHGFASSPLTRKGQALRARLAPEVELELPDLNRPDFAHLTYAGALEAVDGWAGSDEVALIGSSMGGWVAARWAELHPDQVVRLLLLCPGFDLANRWPELLGAREMAAWERRGWIEVDGPGGAPSRLHWEFMEDALAQPAWPELPCPTRIVHGRRDEVVPIEGSRRYAAAREHVRLIEVDDDHSLLDTLDRIEALARDWLAG